MTQSHNPFVLVLWHATDRFYTQPTDLIPDLNNDPHGTLYKLSVQPQAFGQPKLALTLEHRRLRHQQLLDAAKAYVVNTRKPTADAVDQGELPLPS